MFDHIGLKVSDIAASVRLFSAALEPLGLVPGAANETSASFGPPGAPALWLGRGQARADTVWRALSNVGEAHHVFAGVLSDCRLDGENTRTATFTNGLAARERIISVPAAHRWIAYTVTSGDFEHHGASMRVAPKGDGSCRFVWICDVLPDATAERIRPLMEAGIPP